MAQVLGVHEIELTAGTDPSEFEKAAAAVVGGASPAGWSTRILRGERGPRSGKYLLLFEIESLEARDHLFPAEDQVSEQANDEFNQEHPEAAAVWERLTGMIVDISTATDYVEITA